MTKARTQGQKKLLDQKITIEPYTELNDCPLQIRQGKDHLHIVLGEGEGAPYLYIECQIRGDPGEHHPDRVWNVFVHPNDLQPANAKFLVRIEESQGEPLEIVVEDQTTARKMVWTGDDEDDG